MYVHVGVCLGKEECVCGGGDCVGVGVLAWVRKGVCGWDSLHCYCSMCVRRGRGEGKGKCVCVGITMWV